MLAPRQCLGARLHLLIDGLFVSKTFEDVSDDKMPAYIWMAIQSAVVGLTVVM